MEAKLKEILKKAKMIDQRAKEFDTVDKTKLQSKIDERTQNGGLYESMGNTPTPQPTQPRNLIQPGSENYNKKVKESKLPPEIQRAMLDNPIQQPDMPGTFSMNEEAIREINPNYGTKDINQVPTSFNEEVEPKQNNHSVNNGQIRKMIAEEIAKVLPSIVEKYFDRKMIQENVNIWKSLRVKSKKS
tara:strand:+ start:824 stop:1384 length:561 start_codon:yes stop_codon:yes gene_type:complete